MTMDKPIKLVVSGALGRMGSRILALASQDPDFQVVGALEARGNPGIGKEVLPGIRISSDFTFPFSDADILIEFTYPESTVIHLETSVEEIRRHITTMERVSSAFKQKKAIVIGTTGLSDREIERVAIAAKYIPIVLSPNMSIGVNQFFEMIRDITKRIGREYKIEITETHHVHKKDAPSGTAKKLAEIIGQEINKKPEEISTRSIREGEVVGIHTVTFSGNQEKIELTHTADSRDTFALGALRAAKFVAKQKPGLYAMKDVIDH